MDGFSSFSDAQEKTAVDEIRINGCRRMHSMQLVFYSMLALLCYAHSKINVTAKLQIYLKMNAMRSLKTLFISLNFTGIFIHSVVIDYDTRLYFILSKLCCLFRFIYDFFFFFK